MFFPHSPQESGAGGATDVRNPAKSVYHSAVCPSHPKTCYEPVDAIINPALTSSEPCPSPFAPSLLTASSSILSECADSPGRSPSRSGSLYVHPFAHPSARSIYSDYSPPHHWASTSTSFATSIISTDDFPPRPPSSASFIEMDKNPKVARRDAASQAQGSGHRSGRSISDGLPQMIQQARKSGTRWWRALTRQASLFSLSEHANNVVVAQKQPPAISAHTGGRVGTFEKQLPPPPGPYFYPRYPASGSNLGNSLLATYRSNPGFNTNVTPADSPGTDSGYGGEDDFPSSVDSAEIGSWKEHKPGYIPMIVETQMPAGQRSLRQRFATSVVFKSTSKPSSQLRHAHSEIDFRKVIQNTRKVGDVGPGVNNDPFAASPINPQDASASADVSPSLSRATSASVLPQTTTKSPSAQDIKPSKSNRRSVIRPRLGSFGRTKARTLQSPSLIPEFSSLSILVPSPPATSNHTKHFPDPIGSSHQSIASSPPDEIPSLTPDRPSFSHTRAMTPRLDRGQSPYSVTTLPTVDSHEESFDRYEESALEEGTSQEATFFDVKDLASVNLTCVTRYGGPRARHARPLIPVAPNADEALDEVHDDLKDPEDETDHDDVFAADPDLASLKEEWPLPPRRTRFVDPGLGMSWDRVTPQVEYFKPGSLDTSNSRLRVVRPSTSFPDISAVAQGQTEALSRLLQHVKSEPHLTSLQQLSFSPSAASAVATLGNNPLESESFPSIIVLQPSLRANPAVTLVVRAASRADLISFCASHGDTIITASPSSFVSDIERLQAHVKLCRRQIGKLVEEVMTLSVGVRHVDRRSTPSLSESSSGSFSLRLPVILGELAMAIAKSYGHLD